MRPARLGTSCRRAPPDPPQARTEPGESPSRGRLASSCRTTGASSLESARPGRSHPT